MWKILRSVVPLCCLASVSVAQSYEAGELSAGLWYTQGSGAAVTLSYDQPRVFGTDEHVSLTFEGDQYSQAMTLSTVDPDFFDSAYARTIAVTAYNVRPSPEQGGNFSFGGSDIVFGLDRNLGGGLSYGFGVGYQSLTLDSQDALPVAIADFILDQGETTHTGLAFLNLEYDQTIGGPRPSSGYRINNTNELGRTGDISYLKVSVAAENFVSVGNGYHLRTHGQAAHGLAFGDDALPIFKNYYGGGLGSLRGFADGSLGPTSAIPNSTGVAHVGGVTSLFGGVEISHDFSGRDDVYLTGFYDIGNVFDADASLSVSDMRQSVGVAVTWASPIGPLNISLAKPLNDEAGDTVANLQFSFGGSF